uniref:Uncharacterized protein n=1 Tax=Arundo donax TaxID=35708 RepID=A0A0A9HJ18_ARUDO
MEEQRNQCSAPTHPHTHIQILDSSSFTQYLVILCSHSNDLCRRLDLFISQRSSPLCTSLYCSGTTKLLTSHLHRPHRESSTIDILTF